MNKIKLIVAVSKNNVIGNDNELVLSHKEDFERFKEYTSKQFVIMGRKTWESLPKKPLPNRINVIITKSVLNIDDDSVLTYASLTNAISDLVGVNNYSEYKRDIIVIGGASIYEQMLPKVDEMLITRWNKLVEGDTYFPTINYDEWELTKVETPETSIEFKFETWIRKK